MIHNRYICNFIFIESIIKYLYMYIWYELKNYICFPDYSRSPKDRRSRDEYRTNHDRISPEVIYYFYYILHF